jgi:hypothetical protein
MTSSGAHAAGLVGSSGLGALGCGEYWRSQSREPKRLLWAPVTQLGLVGWALFNTLEPIGQVPPPLGPHLRHIHHVEFEACSGFTHVTARRIAQPPTATFVTRLQPAQLPARAARQLPDQSTTLRVDSSSTDDSHLRGALPRADMRKQFGRPVASV